MRLKRLISCCFSLAIFCLLASQPLAQTETGEKEFEEFDYNNFDDPTNIDNEWLPLKPGTQWVYEGVTVEDDESVHHRVVFSVTDLTKVIDGVRTVVAWVLDYSDSELVEKEIAFYAQANDGTVWYLGEHPEEYEDGELVDAPAWIAGIGDGKAGIKMRAEPQLGTPSYSQGWSPAVDWTDRGVVDQIGQKSSVPYGSYEDVLVIAESSKGEPNAFQLKYYARGVGNIRVGWRGDDETQETLELVERLQLDPEAMAKIRAAALELEKNAYKISKDVYAHTAPAWHIRGAEGTVIVLQPSASESKEEGEEKNFEDFNYDNFDNPTNIDNVWLPLKPGTQWVHEGSTNEDGEEIHRRIEFTVTDLTKVIDGVRTVVALILDYSEGELVEKEIAFYAQDNDGTVWYLGEHPEEYEDGKFVEAPSWISGVQDAKAGIFMPAEPRLGTSSFSQGWAPAVDWTDRAQVYKMGQKTTVPAGSYEDVLVMDEFNREEPGFQLKYYERGVGPVRVGYRGEEEQQETMELIKHVQLDPEAMAKIRTAALLLEKNAYEISKDTYAHTEHMLGPEGKVIVLLASVSESEEEEEEDEEEDEVDIIMGERPTLRAGALPPDFKFGGAMNGAAWWAAADSIANLITIEPEEGGTPAGRTVIKVLANQHEIVVGAWCYDDKPKGIVSFSKGRDSELEEEDHILIVFDTFRDGRSGYVFAVNPSGARFDGLVIEQGEDVNSNWDTIWEAKTSRDKSGWYAEIRIPIKSLGFKKDLTSWGFNIQRRVQRLQETSRWSGAKRDFEIYQTSRAGLLTNLPQFDFGVGLSVRTATVGTIGQPDGANSETDGDISLDVTQRLGPNLSAALTVNTDFAETEVDVRQTNLSRFDIFFPEKRSFFLEGADIFEFGVALDEDTMIPFFSRRIGLLGGSEDDLPEIPINAGGKINGRVGNTNIGALVVNTRKIDSLDVGDVDEDIKVHVPQTTMGAVRINQNILEESSVGMIATFGDQRGNSDAWMAGVDFTYRTSEFLNEKNFGISVWGLLNDGKDSAGENLEGDKSAFGFRIDYPNDLLDINFTSIRIGDGFQPALGFVPRNGIHLWNSTVEVNPRPPLPWLRQMFFELSGSLYNNQDNSEWESYEVTIKPLDWLLESGDQVEAGITPEGDRPPEAFEIANNVDIPSGAFSGPYNWTRYFVGARSARKRKIGAEIKWEFGNYYNGDLSTIEANLTLKPSAFFTVEFAAERNTGKVMALPEDVEEEEATELVLRKFKEEVYGVRLLFNISPDLQVSSFTQYDTESKELGSNNRLRWTFHPLGDLFIVYNHNLLRNTENRWQFVSNKLPIKIQYTWRF